MTYAEVFTALADPTRRHSFEALLESPKTVTELAANETVSRPAVSQHLRVLETAQLVGVEPRGNRRVYSIKRDGLEELREYLDRFWSDVLSAYGAEITQTNPEVFEELAEGVHGGYNFGWGLIFEQAYKEACSALAILV